MGTDEILGDLLQHVRKKFGSFKKTSIFIFSFQGNQNGGVFQFEQAVNRIYDDLERQLD